MNGTTSAGPILVVDDDPKIVRLVRTYLERDSFRVVEATDGRAALAAIAMEQPTLVVLDVMLPEVDGLSVLEALRRSSRVPVIMLSARSAVDDRIEGLQLGADDYVVKPFSPAELVARVHRILDRSSTAVTPAAEPLAEPITFKDLTIDAQRHAVVHRGNALGLTRAEFRLLAALVGAEGRVLTRDQLIDAVHGADGEVLDRTVDVHIGRLRRKLGDDPNAPRYVATVRGVGYRVPTTT